MSSSSDLLKWSDLTPDPLIVAALNHAGNRPGLDADQNAKRKWSEYFANGCAVAISTAIRQQIFQFCVTGLLSQRVWREVLNR